MVWEISLWNKSPAKGNKLGFGLDFDGVGQAFLKQFSMQMKPNKISRAILMQAIKRLDQLILDDGSIKTGPLVVIERYGITLLA